MHGNVCFSSLWIRNSPLESHKSHENHAKKKLRRFIQGGGNFSPARLVLSKRHVQENHGVERQRLLNTQPRSRGHLELLHVT